MTARRRLAGDIRGTTAIEFAIIVPVMLSLIMGLGEIAFQGYVQAVLTGAVQKAGRDGSIQGGGANTDAIDATVVAQLKPLQSALAQNCAAGTAVSSAVWCSTRKSYASFVRIAPEPFIDSNNNGVYDAAKDCFTDTNGNGIWDADPGASGQGGANDVAVYTFTMSYPRIFPVFALMGLGQSVTLTGSTVLKNQPWATQATYTPKQVCPK